MKRLETILFFLLFLFNYCLSSYCSNSFESQMKYTCESLYINSTHSCVYSNGKCDFSFKSCSSYTGKDSATCSSIILSSIYKKCQLVNEICKEVDKTCEEYNSSLSMTCSYLNPVNKKRCIYNDDNCETHYDNCADFTTGVDKTKCEANIPSNSQHKCIWKNDACTEVKKECNDYSSTYYYYSCSSLSTSSTDKICVSTNNYYCKEQYKTCELYNTKETSKTKTDCEAINYYSDSKEEFDNTKICSFSGSTCSTRDKTCEDITTGEYDCESFKPSDTDKVCVYTNYQCKSQYKTCELYSTKETSKTQAGCEAIRTYSGSYFDDSKICEYTSSTSTCSTRDKECKDIITGNYDCEDFSPKDTDKICVYSDSKCKEQYKTCELYDEKATLKTKDECEAIRYYSGYSFDTYKTCTFSGTTCSTKEKQCSEMTTEYECSSLTLSDTNKICVFTNNACKEQFKTCELYTAYTESTERNKADCEAIQIYAYSSFDTSSKCVFSDDSNQCTQKKKDCSEFSTESTCNYHQLDDNDKKCLFIGGVCEEQYKTCELYDAQTTKTKEICEKIKPYYDYSSSDSFDELSKCVFEDSHCKRKSIPCNEITESSSCFGRKIDDNHICTYENNQCKEVYKSCSSYNTETNKNEEGCKKVKEYYSSGSIDYTYKCVYKSDTCQKEKLTKCEDYETGQDSYYCTSIYINNYKMCLFNNNKCETVYSSCPGNYEEVTKEVCDNIELSNPYSKCALDENNKCVQTRKECLEYNGTYSYYCSLCVPSEDTENKICYLENEKCVEKYSNCSGYKGNDKSTCESIIPYDNKGPQNDSYYCSYEKNACVMKAKGCEDMETQSDCENLYLEDKNKKCAYINGACEEQYKDCDSYNNNGKEEIIQTKCESIVLTGSDSSYKCVFNPDSSTNKCQKEQKLCYEIKIEDFENDCSKYSPSFFEKCELSNSACEQVNKTCLELEKQASVTSDICSLAATFGSNKECKLKEDNTGCEEKDKKKNGDSFLRLKFSLLLIIFGLLL